MVLVFLLLVAAGVVIGVIVAPYVSPVMTQLAKQVGVPAQAQVGQVREYYIEIKGADIEIAPGVIWKAWTYNKSVPGPTLVAGAGVVAMALAGKPLGKLRGPLLGDRANLKVLAAGALYALGAAGCTLPTFVVFLAYSALVGPEGSVPLMAAYSAGMLVPVGALVVALPAFGKRALERFSALARHSGLLGRTVLLAAGLYMVYVWFSLGVVPLSA
jgi:hypothetical protein